MFIATELITSKPFSRKKQGNEYFLKEKMEHEEQVHVILFEFKLFSSLFPHSAKLWFLVVLTYSLVLLVHQ